MSDLIATVTEARQRFMDLVAQSYMIQLVGEAEKAQIMAEPEYAQTL